MVLVFSQYYANNPSKSRFWNTDAKGPRPSLQTVQCGGQWQTRGPKVVFVCVYFPYYYERLCDILKVHHQRHIEGDLHAPHVRPEVSKRSQCVLEKSVPAIL